MQDVDGLSRSAPGNAYMFPFVYSNWHSWRYGFVPNEDIHIFFAINHSARGYVSPIHQPFGFLIYHQPSTNQWVYNG